MWFQFAFYQFWINTWRSKFEQKTDSILSACWSYGQNSQGSCHDRLGSTASCAVPAKSMEKTLRRSMLGRHQSCDSERIDILSDTIERHHSSWNTPSLLYPAGEVENEKVHMSPRPPPKISLKHEWKRELGSEHAQQSEVGQLSRSFQSNQPILDPNRERTERPVVRDDTRTVQDGRKTSRSQEIDVNSFYEQSVSSDVLFMNAKHSTLETNHFVKERRDLLLIMILWVMSKQCWTRWTWTSEFLDCHILLWSTLRALVFVNWLRRSRTTQIDMFFNSIYDKIKHKPHLVQNQRKWFRKWATSNCLNCSRRNPKRSAQHACHTGT